MRIWGIFAICVATLTNALASYPPVLTEVIPRESSVDVCRYAFVAHVIAGDLIALQEKKGVTNAVIYGIAAPDGYWGLKAKAYLKWKIEGKPVSIEVVGRDRHGRLLIRCYRSGTDVALNMLAMGLARTAPQTDPAMAVAQEAAQKNRIGMWGTK
jgi:endonuclease YncB( thermonuclease family)